MGLCNKLPGPISSAIRVILLWLTYVCAAEANSFYALGLISQTGSRNDAGEFITSFLGESVSINREGNTAFVGATATGQSLYIGNGTERPKIISFATPSTSRTYHNGVQINDGNQVVARDRTSGTSLIRVWDGNIPGTFTTIVRGSISGGTSTFPAAYDSVFSHPSLSNSPSATANPYVVFSALDLDLSFPDRVLATPQVYGETRRSNFNEVQLDTPLRPMVADDGRVTVRAGPSPTDPIWLLSNDLVTSAEFIAGASNGFSEVGDSPGVSHDGSVVGFAGNRGSGRGVFASIDTGAGTRTILKIAGEAGNPIPELGTQGEFALQANHKIISQM